MRGRINRPEEAIHRAIVQFMASALPADAVYWHTPNGGARSKAEGGIFKALGVQAGVPDLFVLHAGKLHAIEVKAPDGRVTAKQGDMAQRLYHAGCTTHVVSSVEAAEQALKLNGVPLRATTGANIEDAARRAA